MHRRTGEAEGHRQQRRGKAEQRKPLCTQLHLSCRVVSRVESKEKKGIENNRIEGKRNKRGRKPVCPPAEHTPAATAAGRS